MRCNNCILLKVPWKVVIFMWGFVLVSVAFEVVQHDREFIAIGKILNERGNPERSTVTISSIDLDVDVSQLISNLVDDDKASYKVFHVVNVLDALNKTDLKITSIPTKTKRRYTYHFGFVIVLIKRSVSSTIWELVETVICASYLPLTSRDQDYYIFKIDSFESVASSEFIKSLKHSIFIKKSTSELKTVCHFCGKHGQSLLIPKEQDINYFDEKIGNLNGKLLKVSIPLVLGEIEADAPWTGVNNARRGSWKYLLEELLMKKFNFTYNMFMATGADGLLGAGGTGLQLPNGTWTGVTGDLLYGRADFGVSTSNTPDRNRVIDFTNAFFYAGCLSFVLRKPKEHYSPLSLMWPFSPGIWLLLAITTTSGFIFLLISSRMIPNHQWTTFTKLIFLISSFLEHDVPILRTQYHSLRFFVACWLFFALILTSTYRSKLTSFWTFPIYSSVPQSFKELAYSNYKIGFMKHGDSAYDTLAQSQDPVYKKLVGKMQVITGVGLECLQSVVQTEEEDYACIGYDFALKHLQHRNLTDKENRLIAFAPEAVTYNIYVGIAVKSRSIFRSIFSPYLGWARQFGLDQKWDAMDMYWKVRVPKLEWWAEETTNKTDKIIEPDKQARLKLTMKQIGGLVFLAVGGFTISLIIFLYELVFKKLCRFEN